MKKNKFMTIITLILLLSMVMFGCNNDTPTTPDDNTQGGGTETPVDPNPEVKPDPTPDREATEADNAELLNAFTALSNDQRVTRVTKIITKVDLTDSDIYEVATGGSSIHATGSYIHEVEGEDINNKKYTGENVSADITISGNDDYNGRYIVTRAAGIDGDTKYEITKDGTPLEGQAKEEIWQMVQILENARRYTAQNVLFTSEQTGLIEFENLAVKLDVKAIYITKDGEDESGDIAINGTFTFNNKVIEFRTSTKAVPSPLSYTTAFQFIKIGDTVLEPTSISSDVTDLVTKLIFSEGPSTPVEPQP